uniref:Uncharacterized protein n=1 Tax=Acanthochromis polyacanthus TaxID=80966 RepID=A0A3Q1FPQ6_9TELE
MRPIVPRAPEIRGCGSSVKPYLYKSFKSLRAVAKAESKDNCLFPLTALSWFRLRNASGQTAADLAHAHGFHDCFCFISNAQKHLQQLHGNENGAPCGQGLFSRKRQLNVVEAGLMKKPRRAEGKKIPSDGMEQSADAASSSSFSVAVKTVQQINMLKLERSKSICYSLHPPSSSPVQHPSSRPQRSSAEMCGSLHLTNSPGSCSSAQPACWGPLGADCGDFLRYGHYHGFGDTAEELSDDGSIQTEHRSKQYNTSIQ